MTSRHGCCVTPPAATFTEAERKSIGTTELRAKAKEFALKTIDAQREQFKRYVGGHHHRSPSQLAMRTCYAAPITEGLRSKALHNHKSDRGVCRRGSCC
jgi:hypothetical protein